MHPQKIIYSLVTALAFLLAACGKPISPQYLGYQKFRVEKIGFKENVFATEVKLYNPNKYALQIKAASMDVFLNNDFLGHSNLDTLINLPALDTTFVPLQLQASAKDILTNTARILLNPDVKIKISGTVKAGRKGFFINVPVDYEGVQRIDILNLK